MILIKDPKTFSFNFNWAKDVDDNLKHDIEFIIKSNESLAENKIKNKIEQLSLNISMKTIFMNMENSKMNESRKFVLNLSQRLDLKSVDKDVALQNFSIY